MCLPIDGGVWLKARETWPRSSRVYCHPAQDVEREALVVLETVAVLDCTRRGPVVDLVLTGRKTGGRSSSSHKRAGVP